MSDTGKPWKPRRRERRVLLALLSGASGLSISLVMRVAQVSSGTAYVTLARLERLGWVTARRENRTDELAPRRFYSLTPDGRAEVLRMLRLEERDG
jgi:DNA-binding MarR family transcriptional regulator